ncbi:unnamed protein product [Albugo candida]|uniref:Uncharacterized protein n=1 Tax=Albugo candida TaxID=65357 RepID=A0A024GS54_9STRA|nr:unnamed protein product [Albugo candida]|eukprot:CCI49617.1 unnamed protein product [Albugo candida]
MQSSCSALLCNEEYEYEVDLTSKHQESECYDHTWLLQDAERRYQLMLQKEICQDRSVFRSHKYRNTLVEWMSQVGEETRIERSIIHPAITYLERFLQIDKSPCKRDLQLIGLCCIMIAAKFNGSESKAPCRRNVWDFGNRAYTCKEINQMELRILSNLSWCLTTIEPIHFLEFHKSRNLLYPDDKVYGHPMISKMSQVYDDYIDFFVDCCLQEYKFRPYRPSVMAASILAVSRKALHIAPLWRKELRLLTGYNEGQIAPCISSIWSYYQLNFSHRHKRPRLASPTSPSDKGATPLIIAIAHGHVEVAKALVEAGADLHQVKTPDQNSPLHEAALNGQVLILQHILYHLQSDQDMVSLVNLRNQFGNTPLHNAALAGSHKCVDELLKAHADVSIRNANGSTPLHHACYSENANCSVIKLLVNAGCNINEEDNNGNTPLMVANRRGQKETSNFLLQCSAEPLSTPL